MDITKANFLEIAARCRRLATTADVELATELKEIADELTARIGELDQEQAELDR
jgi:hypothetical protein